MTRSPPAPLRAVIFSDVNGPVSATMMRETLRFARTSGLLEVAAVVVSDRDAFRVTRARRALRLGRRTAAALFDARVPMTSVTEPTLDLDALERRLRVPVLVPEDGDPNDPRFVSRLRMAFRPHVALSFYCLRIFRRPLLEIFEQCVNYHDSMLPRHRGVLATSFSLYAGDDVTGYTFHRMNESIDGGDILLQGGLPVADSEHVLSVKRRKLAAGAAALPRVLRMVVAGASGTRQVGAGEYHSRRAASAILHVRRPEELEAAELARRLRAFGLVQLTVGGVELPVSRLRPSAAGRRFAFTTSDGAVLEPDRLVGLPAPLYRLARLVDRPAGSPVTGMSAAADAPGVD